MGLQFTPGYYAKVRIDDEGNIVDVADLEAEDLPQHQHTLDDLTDQIELEDRIAKVLSTFFVNNNSNAVVFTYDAQTKTVSADLNIDEDTIVKNEYGQLAAAVTIDGSISGSGSYSDSSSNDSSDSNENSGKGTSGAGTVYINTAAGGSCASHTHTAEQIEDLEETVKSYFDEYSENININLESLVDGVTVKVNQYGQLTAVRTALEKHTHYLADIIDYVAPEAATKQMMSTLGEDVDLSNGVIDLSKLNVGYSIIAINRYLQDVVAKNLNTLNKKVENLNITKDNLGQAILSVDTKALHNHLLDKNDNKIKEVFCGKKLNLILDYLPYEKGTINLFQDGNLIESQDIESLKVINSSIGRFKVSKIYSKNAFSAKVLTINISDLITLDKEYDFYIQFETEDGTDITNTVELFCTPNEAVNFSFTDISNTHELNDTEYYDSPVQYKYQIKIQDYDNYRFVNTIDGFNSGVLTGVATSSGKITLNNLFGESKVELKFEHEVENSQNDLQKSLSIESGAVINDQLTPKNDMIDYKAVFVIPGSARFNTLYVSSTDSNFDIEKTYLEKGTKKILGTKLATESENGVIDICDGEYLLSFANGYDAGKDSMKFTIKTNKVINLDKIHFEVTNL